LAVSAIMKQWPI